MTRSDALRPKQQKFVEEYLVDLNATQAAIRAGYSPKTANVIGCENLTKPNIQLAIQRRRAELAKHVLVTPESVVEEYAKLGFADMDTYVAWGPDGVTLKESSELPSGATVAVSEVSETTTEKGSTIRFKLHDKKGALDSLAKHLGMFVEKIEHSGPGGGPIPLTVKEMSDDDLLKIAGQKVKE